jgi:L-fucose mutarotase
MLLGLDPLLGGDLLATLREMGHGDTLCIADSNFPAVSSAKARGARLLRMDTDAVTAGRAILSVLPLDSFVENPIWRMGATDDPEAMTDAHTAFLGMVHEVAGERWTMGAIERFDFYPEAEKCVAIVATLERRPYANFILKKGVVGPDGKLV